MAEQQYVQLPDSSYYPLSKGESAAQAYAVAMQKYPEAFATAKPAEAEKPKADTGLLSELGAGFRGGAGSALSGLGELTGLEGLRAYGEKQKAKAAETPEAEGILGDIARGTGSIAGRFGAPILAGIGATALLPEAVASAPIVGALTAGRLAGAAGFAAVDAPTNIGEHLEAQKAAGQKPDMATAIAVGVGQTALNLLGGEVISSPMRSVLGKTAAEQASTLVPDILAGKMTAEEASKQVGGYLRNFLQGTAQNAAVGTGLMAGSEAMTRAGLGQDVTSPEAIEQYMGAGKSALEMAPLFGAFHAYGARGQAKGILGQAEEAHQVGESQKAAQAASLEAQRVADQEAIDEAHKQTSTYALDIGKQYDKALAKRDEMLAGLVKPDKSADPATRAQYVADLQAVREHTKNTLMPLVPEYNRTRALRKQELDKQQAEVEAQKQAEALKEQQRQAGIEQQAAGMPQDAQTLAYHQEAQGTLPGIEPAPKTPEPPKAGPTPAELHGHLQYLQRLKDDHQAQEREIGASGDLDAFEAFSKQTDAVNKAYADTAKALKDAGGFNENEPHPALAAHDAYNKAYAEFHAKSNMGSEEGYDRDKALNLLPKVKAAKAHLDAVVAEHGEAPEATQQSFNFGPEDRTNYSEPKAEFAARVYKPGAPEAEAQEQAFIEDARRRDDAENARLAKVRPEINALGNIGARKNPELRAANELENNRLVKGMPERQAKLALAQQQDLFDTGNVLNAPEEIPKKTRPEDRLYRQLERAFAEDPSRWLPEQRRLLERISENLDVIELSPKRMEMVSDWLYHIDHNRSMEKLATQEGSKYVKREDFRARDLTAELNRMDEGKRSETEGGKTAVQGELKLGEATEAKGKLFNTPQEFQAYLAGDALNDMRRSMGLVHQTMSRMGQRVAPMQARAESLLKQITGLQAHYEKLKEAKGTEIADANKMVLDAKKRQSALTQRLDEELKDLQAAYIKAKTEFDFAVQTSHDISKNFAANEIGELADKVVAAKAKMMEAMKKPVTKSNWDVMRVEQAKVVAAVREHRNYLNKMHRDPEGFLNRDLDFQLQLQHELDSMAALQHNLTAAKFDLDMAVEKQERSRKNKAEAKASATELETAEKIKAEAVAANEARDKEAAEILTQIKSLDDRRSNLQRVVDEHLGRIKAVASERAGPPLEESKAERELKDGAARIKEQQSLERLESLPGEEVSFEPRRKVLDKLSITPDHLEALDESIKDADQVIKHIEALNVKRQVEIEEKQKEKARTKNTIVKEEIEKDIVKRQEGIVKGNADIQKIEKTKEDLHAEIINKTKDVTEYNELFSGDPEIANAALKVVHDRIPKVLKLIETVQGRLKETDVKPSVKASRVRDLRNYKKELAELEAKANLMRGIERRPVGGSKEMLKTEAVEAGTRLPSRIIGPVVKPVVTAGNIRTGTTETIGERKLPPKNKATQAGEKRGVTSIQAQRSANKAVEEGLFKEAKKTPQEAASGKYTATQRPKIAPEKKTKTDLLLEHDALTDEITENENKLHQAEMDDDHEAATKYEALGVELEKKLEEIENQMDRHKPTVFRTSTKQGAGMKEENIKTLVDRMTHEWEKMPEVEIVGTEKDLPEHIRNQLTKDEKTGLVPGLYDPTTKKVYLVASNLHDPQDVVMTVLHEIAGHHGLRELLGETYARTMNTMYEGNKALREKVNARMKAEPKLSREIAVEETLADMAEQAPRANERGQNVFRRIGYAIKQWIAKMFGITHVSDEEVLQLVANARRYVKKGLGAAGGESGFRHFLYRTTPEYGAKTPLTEFANRVVAQPKTWREKLGSHAWLQAEMDNVDMRAGVREALRLGAKATGDSRSYEQAMYNITKADQKSSFTRSVLLNGGPLLYTDEKGFRGVKAAGGVTYMDIMKPISEIPGGNARGKIDQATAYFIAVRAGNKGLAKLDLGALGVTEAELKAVKDTVDADPRLKAALEKSRTAYNEYNKNLINWLASTGAIPKGVAEQLLKEGDYVPFYRIKENGQADLVFSSAVSINIGDIRHQPYLHELKGGETKIMPLDESIQRNTTLIVDKGLTNLAVKNTAYAMQKFGEGHGQLNPITGKRENLMPIHRGHGPADPNIIRFNQEPDPAVKGDTGERWLKIKTDGTVLGGIPAEIVIQSLEGAHLTLPAFLKLGGLFGDVLRSGVTRSPLYAVRQLIKDPMSMAFTGGLDYGPLRAVLKAGTAFIDMSRGDSKTEAKLIEKGLIQSGIFTGDQSDMAKFALQLASGKDASAITRLFAMADRVAMRADSATRVLVYENAIKKGLSETQADMFTMESMNYYKRGLSPTLQYANRMIPFFNSQIQGLNVLYKAARGQMPYEEQLKIKQKFMNNAMMLMGAGLVYGMAMQDDEYYMNAKPKDRYSNFFLHLPGVDEPMKLPLPYEAGYFFSAAVAAVDAMVGKTDTKQQLTALKDMFLNSVPGYTSDFIPQIAKPAFEVAFNHDFYTGDNIESNSMQRKSIDERYNNATTEWAKAMSKAIPVLSPIQVDYMVKGYLGQLPIAAMKAADGLFKSADTGEKPAMRASDLPIIGGQFQRKYGGAETDVVYDLAKHATQASDTYKSMLKQGRRDDAKEYLEDHRGEIYAAGASSRFEKVMGALRMQEDIARNNKTMTPDEKRAKLDALDALKQKETTVFMQAIKDAEARGKTAPQLALP